MKNERTELIEALDDLQTAIRAGRITLADAARRAETLLYRAHDALKKHRRTADTIAQARTVVACLPPHL